MNDAELLLDMIDSSEINVYSEPDSNSEIVCKIGKSTEVMVDVTNSTENFYKIYTVFGAEGFCHKAFITIDQ